MQASQLFSSKFRGRVLSEENSAVLQRILEVIKTTSEEIRIYDVSRWRDKLEALFGGIRKTPTIVIDGEKHVGQEKCLAILDKHCSK